MEAILELGHFPAGMEAFPAADSTPWDLIKTIIADSDYYVLIVGGRYGSTGPDGISYTEMEFNLAIELGKPVLAFIHGEPEAIPAGKVEMELEARQRLNMFREKVAQRHCKPWTNKENLKAAVLLALVYAIRTKPAFGWVRNEGLENQELLKRLAVLQERFDALEAEALALRAAGAEQLDTSKFKGLNSLLELRFTYGPDKAVHAAETSLSDIFFAAADDMLVPYPEYRLKATLRPVVIASLQAETLAILTRYATDKEDALKRNLDVLSESVSLVLRQLLALGLVEPQMVLRQSGDDKGTSTVSQRCWLLTKVGRARYLEKGAILASDG